MSDIALPKAGAQELPRAERLPRTERLLSDERLAKLAGRGDARAFAAIYERHHQAIYRYCRSIVRNDHDAQDALQSAMMRAYVALRGRERDLAVRPWLFRIAHNEAISILRRRGPEQELDERFEQLDGGVEHTLDARERLATLVADLRALPERQRGALLMRELSGLSIAEIAGALSISHGAAKQTLFEARSSLHEYAEGRAMECEAVRRAVSERDGRVLRGRKLRAHLGDCEGCREFRELIDTRGADLRALAPPLPATLASATLARLLAHGGGAHVGGAAASGSAGAATAGSGGGAVAGSGGGAGAGSGASLGGHAVGSILVKGMAGVVVLATATAGTVHLAATRLHDRGTVVEKVSTSAGGTRGESSTGVPNLRAGFSFGSSKSQTSIGSSPLHNDARSAGGASLAGAAHAQTPAAAGSGRGGAYGAAHNQAAQEGRSGVKSARGTGGRSRGHNHQTGGRSHHGVNPHRHVKEHAPTSSPSHSRHHGESVAKRQTPKHQGPQAAGGSGEPAKSEHEAAVTQPPSGTSGEARQSATQKAG